MEAEQMEALQIALCEDRAEDRQQLLGAIEAGTVPAQVHAFESGEAFLSAWQPGRFDLIFMDIYMDGMSGVEVIGRVRESDPEVPVAFTTTSRDHALDGYRLDVAKYMEKPVAQSAVDEVLELAKERKAARPGAAVLLGDKAVTLPVEQLLYVEQKAHYLAFSYLGGRTELIKGRLDELSPQLDAYPFFRCHKSYLVNLSYITGIDRALLLFRMQDEKNVYIRRESFKSAKEAWESWLFSQARKGGESQ